ncbi:hypothetical protein PC9H_000034 [Pleurotus ostreatus]|uniref:Fungal-type protein kinase domain-containing protein n=1 Tax=Pleurotus ostreatus TaxID=5322 RepID=A0A8H7A145_PLEOS|nr:uncharacterized protein PC9H_000034 [Pleurotus ostreatus]KAF7439698.1 hypothetical protein PC9H_000034 [Pleurotus ostreatus]
MAHHIISQTTPVKKTKPPAVNRRQMSDIVDRTGYLTPSATFSSLRLHKSTTRSFATILNDKELLQLVNQFRATGQTDYGLLAQLLSRASVLIRLKYAKGKDLVVFRDNHSRSPKYHPNDTEAGAPDLVGLLEAISLLLDEDDTARIPWHHILTIIEEKGKADRKDGPRQSGAYLAFANQSRPDLVGMYGLSISPAGYIIQYSCPAGLQTSEEFPWSDLVPLVSYVYTLYVPHPDFATRDPSVTLADTGDVLGPPAWNIRDGDKVYENCVVRVVGDPWHRMTWVAKVGDTPITIKDSYRDVHSSFREGELYDILHKEGPAPGFLRVKKEYEVQWKRGCPITVTVDSTTRIKTRLIMHTWGESLRKCPSLIDFLKCMYDILEAHRWAVMERNIIHRDISHGNIFVEAEDFKGEDEEEFKGTEYRPIFVNEIIEKQENADPMARLGDLDNAAELDRKAAVSPSFVARRDTIHMNDEPLRCRTGTPKFIARSPALGCLLVDNIKFRRMPTLPSHLADQYALLHSNDRSGLRTFTDDGPTRHGGVYTEETEDEHDKNPELRVTQFEHRPRHDAESVFWCIVVFLLLAVPLGSAREDPQALKDPDEFGLNCAWKYIANHEIGVSDDMGDSRLSIIHQAKWKKWLHPELAHAEGFLLSLTAQIAPEWGLIEPAPLPLHLHEAMQRIILQYIDLWKTQNKDVQFDTGRIRPAEIPDNRIMPQVSHKPSVNGQLIATGSLRPKRQSNQLGPKEESQAKRRRITRQGTDSYKEVPRSLPPSPRFKGRRITRQGTESYEKDTASYKEVPQSLPLSPRFFPGCQLPLEYSPDADTFTKSLPSTPASLSTNLRLSPTLDPQALDTDSDAEA